MTQKIWLGAHTSASGGLHFALYEGREIGATAIQLFTTNQRQWNSRSISQEEIALWQKALEETKIEKVMSHDSYLINLGASNEAMLQKSKTAFREELRRCHALSIPYLNFHPGTAGDGSKEQCLQTIVESLLEMEDLAAGGNTRLLVEATAGQGSSVGDQFEDLAYIVKSIHRKIPIGVTIDTCHIFAAGYDIRTGALWQKVLSQFDQIVGLDHLHAFHLNDSMKELGCKVDRHAPIGEGKIGLESFRFLMTEPTIRHLPKYLETPDGPELWKKEIAKLKSFAEESMQ